MGEVISNDINWLHKHASKKPSRKCKYSNLLSLLKLKIKSGFSRTFQFFFTKTCSFILILDFLYYFEYLIRLYFVWGWTYWYLLHVEWSLISCWCVVFVCKSKISDSPCTILLKSKVQLIDKTEVPSRCTLKHVKVVV